MARTIEYEPLFNAGVSVNGTKKKFVIPISAGTPAGAAAGWIWQDSSNGNQITYHDGTSELVLAVGSTAEQLQDIIGPFLADSSDLDFTYDDAGNAVAAIIKPNAVSYAEMQQISATARILGRKTAGAGNVEELTGADVRTILGVLDADTLGGLSEGTIQTNVINSIVAGAGSAWDTLLEIKAFIQADESTAAALATTVAGKARFKAAAVPNGATPQTINHAMALTNKDDWAIVIRDTATGVIVEYNLVTVDVNNVSVIDDAGTAIPAGLRYFMTCST